MTWRTKIYRFLFKLLDTLMVLQNWYFWPSNKSIGSYTTPSSVIVRKTATWRRFNHGEIPKERWNSSKHQNATKKIFQTSSLIEYYRQSVIIHINSTENIRSYVSWLQMIFFASFHIDVLCPYQKKSCPLSVDNQ